MEEKWVIVYQDLGWELCDNYFYTLREVEEFILEHNLEVYTIALVYKKVSIDG